MQSSTNQDQMEKELLKHWKQMGALKRLAGTLGVTSLMRMNDEQIKQVAAENAAVRQAMGMPEPESESCENSMNTILGDVTYPTPIVVNSGPPQRAGMSPLAASILGAALGLGVPGAGLAGYLLAKPPSTPVVTEDSGSQKVDDETVELRLGNVPITTDATE